MLLICFALTLLATVGVAPIRNSGLATLAAQPDCRQANFEFVPNPLINCIRAAVDPDAVLQDDTLSLGEEEQDQTESRDELGIALLVPSSLHKIPGRPPIALRSLNSHYPLRC